MKTGGFERIASLKNGDIERDGKSLFQLVVKQSRQQKKRDCACEDGWIAVRKTCGGFYLVLNI